MKQIHIILVCLNFVDDNPEYAPSVGCLWNTENTFLIHSGIFGKFINRKANTINRNFRTHGFKRKKSSCLMREQIPKKFNLHDLPDAANWFQRECQGFSKKTTEKESIKWEFHQIIPKKHIEKIEPKEKKLKMILSIFQIIIIIMLFLIMILSLILLTMKKILTVQLLIMRKKLKMIKKTFHFSQTMI